MHFTEFLQKITHASPSEAPSIVSRLKNVFRYNYLYDIKSVCYEREYIGKNSLFEEEKKGRALPGINIDKSKI